MVYIVSSRRRIVGVSLTPHYVPCVGLLRFSLFEAVKNQSFIKLEPIFYANLQWYYRKIVYLQSISSLVLCCILLILNTFKYLCL